LPVFLGVPASRNFAIDKLNDLEYTTALGLVMWANQNLAGGHSFPVSFPRIGHMGNKMKGWLKSLWPSA